MARVIPPGCRVTFLLSPAANQVALVVPVTMYRGELGLNVITDQAKRRVPLAEELVDGILARPGARECAGTLGFGR